MNAEAPAPPTTILARRSMTTCRCHGSTWVVGCPKCGADAYAWRYGRPGELRSNGWSCIACGQRGGLWRLEEAA